jgi:hypothetical protein
MVASRAISSCSRHLRAVAATLALVLAAALITVACDKVPLTAPTGSTLTLSTNATIVPLNGTADITATVIESAGTAVHNGTLVTFTTTVGTLEPAEARTHNGSATVKLHAGSRSGRATVRAFSGDAASGTGEGEAEFFIDIGAAAAGRVTLTASPTTVPPSGGTVTLLAVVFDVAGNRLAGVPVSFTTTAGTLGTSVVTANANGEASTTLNTNRDAEVTATVSGPTETEVTAGTANVTVTTLPTVGVTVTTATPTVDQPVVFQVTAAATAPNAITNVTINFGDGQSLSLGAVSASTSVSHVYQSTGTFTVTVAATDTSGARVEQRTTVVVQSLTPSLVSMSATPSTVDPGQIVTFQVTVTNQGGSTPVVQSVTFNFGDGNVSEAAASLTRTHIYGVSGNFLVTATVRFADGTTRTAEAAVHVN